MAAVEGTEAAFAQMISERGVYKKLGVDRSTVAHWKRGQSVSLDKMEEMLKKYGASVVREKVWEIPE